MSIECCPKVLALIALGFTGPEWWPARTGRQRIFPTLRNFAADMGFEALNKMTLRIGVLAFVVLGANTRTQFDASVNGLASLAKTLLITEGHHHRDCHAHPLLWNRPGFSGADSERRPAAALRRKRGTR
jgi:hypothetical protein